MNQPSDKLRIGVVGSRYGQQVLIPAFRRHAHCEVTAIAATTESHALTAARQSQVPNSYAGWQALIDSPEVDAIAIAVAPSAQLEPALHALANGKPVFCEKPLASTLEAASELVSTATSTGLANTVDFLFPEIPPFQDLKSAIEAGAIGNLRHVTVNWCVETYANRVGIESWKSEVDEGGGGLANVFSHGFHYLEWLFGSIVWVNARLFRSPTDQRTGDTFASLALEFESGIGASVGVATAAPLVHRHRLELFGDDGTLVLENDTADYVYGFRLSLGDRDKGFRQVSEFLRRSGDPDDGRILAAAEIAGRFIEWADGGASCRPNFNDGLRVQMLLDAARQSDQTGERIIISHECR
tara:strand:- start:101 stop:1165 length:1065 start_codon:yes stop_codon:yes gene_type:complete